MVDTSTSQSPQQHMSPKRSSPRYLLRNAEHLCGDRVNQTRLGKKTSFDIVTGQETPFALTSSIPMVVKPLSNSTGWRAHFGWIIFVYAQFRTLTITTWESA